MNNTFLQGTPLIIAWHFNKPDGAVFNLDGYELKLQYSAGHRYSDATGINVVGNTVSWAFPADKQKVSGEHNLKLYIFQNGKLFCKFIYDRAFTLYRGGSSSSPTSEASGEEQVVDLFTTAEFYLFRPVVPTVGDDGYWYVNGEKITDGNGEYIPSSHTVEYDAETNNIIIDRGRVDSKGRSIAQTITAIADMVETVMKAEGTPADEPGDNTRWGQELQRQINERKRQKDEGDETSEPGDNNRWGWEMQRQINEDDRQEAEGNVLSEPGDGSRIGNEKQRQLNEQERQDAEGTPEDDPDDPDVKTRWAQYKRALAATARANEAAAAAEHEVDIHRGPGIENITQPVVSTVNGGENTIRITYSDGKTFDVKVRNGKSSAGFFQTAALLNSGIPSPNVGDYAFVSKAGDGSFPAYIYVCATAGSWSATTVEFTPDDPTDIEDSLNSDSITAALSAKQGKVLDDKVSQLGQEQEQIEEKAFFGKSKLYLYQGSYSSVANSKPTIIDVSTIVCTKQIYFNSKISVKDGYYIRGVYYYNSENKLVETSPVIPGTDTELNITKIGTNGIVSYCVCFKKTNDGNISPTEDIVKSFIDLLQEQIDTINVSIQTEQDRILSVEQRTLGANSQILNLQETSGKFIDGYGVIESSSNFAYTEPFYVEAGQMIFVVARGYNTAVAMISRVITDGVQYTPLVMSIDSASHQYTYIATESGYYAASFGTSLPHKISVADNIPLLLLNRITALENKTESPNLMGIFTTFGACGDSLISGVIEVASGNIEDAVTNYNLSWAKQVSIICGNEYSHYSQGGLTAKTWMQTFGASVASKEAYFLALGTNDYWNKTNIPLGTSADIGTSEETFYRYYGDIVTLLKTTNPNAKIFVCSLYSNEDDKPDWNNAVKYFADNYTNVYYLDFSQFATKYRTYKNGSHYNAIGYKLIALDVLKQIDTLITANWQQFRYVGTY